MMDVFDCGAVLFESDVDEEFVRVECAVTPEGGLHILQESAGPMTAWCFEESPHRIEAEVAPEGTRELTGHFGLDAPYRIPAMLRMRFVGYDCFRRIRALLSRLEIPYRVIEAPIVR